MNSEIATVLHELRYDSVKSPKCFGYEVCGADACENDDGDEDLSFWVRERTVSIILIVVAVVVVSILVCICCCVCCG